jgi:D-alanyl-D-alanine carboxypeptidase/D-alanyl-D-alanine-endopeptidase (penicillin-binding protein 4)
MRIGLLIIFSVVWLVQKVEGQAVFQKSIQLLLNNKALKGSLHSISVIESGSGKSVFKSNDNISLVPASVLKTITSSTALEVLGPDYVFRTKVGYTGSVETDTGILKGDLVVTGGGDPTLGSAWFNTSPDDSDFAERWTGKILGSGIREIEGNLLIDPSIYTDNEIPGT